jgi:16S rRNA (cytidine1402-2'-O)-methyltransferase
MVAAEDTRHTGQLLAQYGISVPLYALHEHNEADRAESLIQKIKAGEDVALVSDAGTPLVSDPGYRVVAAAAAAGIRVEPLPGACAAIAALSVAGLPTDRFVFEGFLPPKSAARRGRLAALAAETRTLVFYESPHRLKETLADLCAAFGPTRRGVVARELTKLHESVYRASLADLNTQAEQDPNMSRGECVLVVEGAEEAQETSDAARYDEALKALIKHTPLSVAADVISELTGARRNALYERALTLRRDLSNESA